MGGLSSGDVRPPPPSGGGDSKPWWRAPRQQWSARRKIEWLWGNAGTGGERGACQGGNLGADGGTGRPASRPRDRAAAVAGTMSARLARVRPRPTGTTGGTAEGTLDLAGTDGRNGHHQQEKRSATGRRSAASIPGPTPNPPPTPIIQTQPRTPRDQQKRGVPGARPPGQTWRNEPVWPLPDTVSPEWSGRRESNPRCKLGKHAARPPRSWTETHPPRSAGFQFPLSYTSRTTC